MNTFKTHARPSWIVGCSRGISERAPGLDANDGARFIGILSASRLIRRHADLLRWLEEMRAFLPHQILIAAWGDFQRGNVKCEVVSHLPGLRAVQGRGCALDAERFVAAGGQSRFIALAHLLLCQLDIVRRRLAAFRLDGPARRRRHRAAARARPQRS
jgi:hypothetical protein